MIHREYLDIWLMLNDTGGILSIDGPGSMWICIHMHQVISFLSFLLFYFEKIPGRLLLLWISDCWAMSSNLDWRFIFGCM